MASEGGGVVLVDDDPEYCLLWRLALEDAPGLSVLGESADLEGVDALPGVERAALVLVDGGLLADPRAAARRLRTTAPSACLVAALRGGLDEHPPATNAFEPGWSAIAKGKGPTSLAADLARVLDEAGRAPIVSARAAFAGTVSAPSESRRFLVRACGELVPEAVLDTATLLTSELVTNAAVYTHQACEVEVRIGDGALAVSVVDCDRTVPHRLRAGVDDPTGRGLDLVERLSVAWGCERSATGKRIAFALAVE